MSIKLAITLHEREVCVWVMLDNPTDSQDPTDRGESFIVGSGPTLAAALTDAEAEMARAFGELAALLHDARLGLSLGTAIVKVARP
jgi:hypothetical protein